MTSTDVTVKKDGEIVEAEGFDKGELAQLDSRIIPQIQREMELAKKLVFTVLEKDVDYGHQPGTQGMALWDPGASKIIRAFHCHAEHKVIFHEESNDLITWTVEANIIYNTTKEIAGQGLGSASTRETKYKYRWVKKAEALALGYSDEDIAELKTRESKFEQGVLEYRIVNPEYGDLANTLLLMAGKRSEVDAAKSLPGVGSALRILFDPKLAKEKGVSVRGSPPSSMRDMKDDYKRFWSIVKGMGITEQSVHMTLGVKHMEEWIAGGHTLDEAIVLIGKRLMDLVTSRSKQPRQERPSVPPAPNSPAAESTGSRSTKTPQEVKQEQVKTVDDLLAYANQFWGLEEGAVWRILNYYDRQNFLEAAVQSPWEAFHDVMRYQDNFKA